MADDWEKELKKYERRDGSAPKSIGQDLLNSLRGLPSVLGDTIKSLPFELYGAGEQIVSDPLRAAQNIGGGLGEFGHGILSGAGNVRDYLVSRGIAPESTPSFRLPEEVLPREFGYAEALGREGHKPGDTILESAPGFAGYGGLFKAAAQGARLTGALSQGLNRAAAPAAYALGQNEDPIQMALLQESLGALGHGVGSFLKNSTNLRHPIAGPLRGQLSYEHLRRNLEATTGTNTPLGDVIQSPMLKHLFENVTAEVPFGGGKDILTKIKTQVEDAGAEAYNMTVRENVTGDVNENIKSQLEAAYKNQEKKKQELYRERNRIAAESGIKLDLPNFSKLAESSADAIKESPLLRHDPDFKRIYNKLLGLKDPTIDVKSMIVDEEGKPLISDTIYPTISEATQVKSNLYNEGEKLKQSPLPNDRSLGKLLLRLSSTLDKDIKNTINESGNESLIASHSQATTNYKNNFSQFLEKNLYKLIDPKKDGEAIAAEIIRPSLERDQAKRIQQVQNVLPEDQRNLLGNAYLQKAINKEGDFDPKKLANRLNKLGPRQFEALFPNQNVRDALLSFGRLRGLNEEALNVMFNPKTGFRNTGNLIGISEASAGATSLLAGNPIAAIASIAIPAIGARAVNKILTSESFREKLVNRMINLPVNRQTQSQHYAAAIARAMTPSAPLELEVTEYQRAK